MSFPGHFRIDIGWKRGVIALAGKSRLFKDSKTALRRFRLSAVCSKPVNSAALADFGCGYCVLFTLAATGLASLTVRISRLRITISESASSANA